MPTRSNEPCEQAAGAGSLGGGGASRRQRTIPGGGNLYLVPGDAATIYDTPNPILNANYSSATQVRRNRREHRDSRHRAHQNQTVQNYRSNFLGNTAAPTITNLDSTTLTGDNSEPYIDMEIAGGLAPGATIHYYVGQRPSTRQLSRR